MEFSEAFSVPVRIEQGNLIWRCAEKYCDHEGPTEEMATLNVERYGQPIVLCPMHAEIAEIKGHNTYTLPRTLEHMNRHSEQYQLWFKWIEAWRNKIQRARQ